MALWTMGNTALLYCWIALGSALGGVTRYWCSGVAARLFGETFPWGTLFVNVSGSFLIGLFATLTGPDGRMFAGSTARQFVMFGLLGGFTTFSSFSLQTLSLAQDSEWFQAGGNIVGSVVLCLLAVWLGHLFAQSINAMKWI
jgi:CrcB protein